VDEFELELSDTPSENGLSLEAETKQAAQETLTPAHAPQEEAGSGLKPFAQSSALASPLSSKKVGSGLNPPTENALANASSLASPPQAKLASQCSQPKPQEASQLVYEEVEETKGNIAGLLICLGIFGFIGALCFAGISVIYFSVGRRVGILFIAFFAALGARLGSNEVRGKTLRWYAAFTAASSAVMAKALLVLLLFHMYPDFNAEDWTNFANPGKSAAIYAEQAVVNALSVDDTRTSQERLDERFLREYEESGVDYEDDEYYEDEEPEPLKFADVMPKLFDVFDLPLIIAAMIAAFKMAKYDRY